MRSCRSVTWPERRRANRHSDASGCLQARFSFMPSALPLPRVFLLKPGSILRDGAGRILDARSSVTLVAIGRRRIIVDTGLADEGELIDLALRRLNLSPEDIDTVVNTHSHPDHCGNNHLFAEARVQVPREGEEIAPGVKAIETPGHSLDSKSIVVFSCRDSSKETIVIAGDALPTFGNFLQNVPPALHVDRDLSVQSMARIIAIADVVIPGHGWPFSIRERRIVDLDG
jgi:glyoxylase-like metal-dependent hydrolase (beta-lactamase superfamily II)